ncbi:hypothetical protein [Sphingosinithalassobacter sp. LHW66-3]|uniref:endonuclease toxin domain-containing protein n=1 Tax=Sphingosinithalassobacter sp. LHW66-3 TaxID=3424718 RepID=UPI003D6A3D7A
MQISMEQRRAAFRAWLRTGRAGGPVDARGREFKFNPWHDARTGRFTFAGQGRYFARSAGGAAPRVRQDAPTIELREILPPVGSREEADTERDRLLALHGDTSANRALIEDWRRRQQEALAPSPADPPNPLADFATGVAEGVYDVAEGAVTGTYTLLTTSPITTVGAIGSGIAGTIDAAIEAEDTPTYVHLSRAIASVATASPHDLGYASGSVLANIGLAIGPQAAASRVSSAVRAEAVIPAEMANPWLLAPTLRGEAIEKALGHNVTVNFPVVDRIINREITSIKSIDLDAASHRAADRLRGTLTGYVDKISRYSGTRERGWGGLRLWEEMIGHRVLELAVPHAANALQQRAFEQVSEYSASLPRPVQVRIVIVREVEK